MRHFRLVILVTLCALGRILSAAEKFDIRANYTKQEFRIPMHDGVHLFTAAYIPKGASEKYPILMTRTPYSIAPYGTNSYPDHLGPSEKFAQDKFIFVYQDVRGRFMSEGQWVEMRPEAGPIDEPAQNDESTDTYDTIDWLIKNIPNNNGKVGLVGISYPGFYTSAGLIHSHPALVAASPQAPISDLYMGDDAYHNGAFFLIANFGFYTSFAPQHNPEAPRREKEFPYKTKDGYKFYLDMGPLVNSEERYFQYRNPYWTDMIRHPNYDEFWRNRNILPHLRDVKPAVLIVGGWFDAEDLAGTLNTYRTIERQSPATLEKLVMGPWYHGGWARSKGDKLGMVSFGSNTSEFFRDQIELPFFRHYLKDAPDADLPKAYVFETGKNVWERKNQWPPANAQMKKLYFRADGKLSFEIPSEASAFDEYVSDPNQPVPFASKPTLEMDREYMDADQRFAKGRPDVIFYQTDPLTGDLTVAGPITPTLFVSTTGTDSDFIVKLIDVYPDGEDAALRGYEQLVRGEPFRGKFRDGFEHPHPFTPGRMEEIHFTMPDVNHCFRKGHRIMIEIQSSWFPLVDRNPQTFTNIPTAKASDFVKATERIYRSVNAASFIQLNLER